MKTCNFKEDCTTVPIDDRCIEFCLERILRSATVEEKQLILGLDATTANDIFNVYQDFSINSFQDLQKYLTVKKTNHIIKKFKSLNQYQLDYFNADEYSRTRVIQAIRDINKSEDMAL